ncbi:unnamed protein product [Leuciscus chuanchicus]
MAQALVTAISGELTAGHTHNTSVSIYSKYTPVSAPLLPTPPLYTSFITFLCTAFIILIFSCSTLIFTLCCINTCGSLITDESLIKGAILFKAIKKKTDYSNVTDYSDVDYIPKISSDESDGSSSGHDMVKSALIHPTSPNEAGSSSDQFMTMMMPRAGKSLCALNTPVGLEVSKGFKKILYFMNYDEVSCVVHSDRCIKQLGEHIFNRMGSNVTKHDYIRQKMREVGRLLLEARKITPLRTMVDFIIPAKFKHVIAVKVVSGYDEEKNSYRIPSLALKLGHSLNKICSIVERSAMMYGDHDRAECARGFRKTHQASFAALAKVTLSQVILFNRRREAEVSRMLLSSFKSRDSSELHEDIAICLSEFERKLCLHFTRVEIRGKRGRKVPVLLKPSMVSAMELLVETRELCGVPAENPFTFARCGAMSAYRGGECINKAACEYGIKTPEALSSTRLRKHIATMSKILNLNKNEADQLADFLSHDIRIHRPYYRLPEGTLQLAKMSIILMAKEKGTLSDYKVKKLDDIEIDPNAASVQLSASASNTEHAASDKPSTSASNTEQSLVASMTVNPPNICPPQNPHAPSSSSASVSEPTFCPPQNRQSSSSSSVSVPPYLNLDSPAQPQAK